MSSYLDYAGRKVDVLAFRGAKRAGNVQLDPDLVGASSGSICTGIQMLAQDWLLEFFKSSGSAKYAPDSGCDFMSLFRRNRIRTELDVFQIFNLSQGVIRANMLRKESASDSDDERFSSAKLEKVTISANRLSLVVRITAVSGRNRKIILPIPIVV